MPTEKCFKHLPGSDQIGKLYIWKKKYLKIFLLFVNKLWIF